MKIVYPDGSINYSGDLTQNKTEALNQISKDFLDTAGTNSFMCSFGYEIDNRWVGKNDSDNARCAIEAWYENQTHAYFRDKHNVTHVVNLDQMKQLLKEGQQNRLMQFALKWKKEYLVETASSNELIWQIMDMTADEINQLIP